jgi:hypothetical protein
LADVPSAAKRFMHSLTGRVKEIRQMVPQLLAITCSALIGQMPSGSGAIEGTVYVVSDGRQPGAGVEVALRVALNGQFVPLAETTADAQGKFSFAPLPLGQEYIYLPGANRDGIHYPGQRIQLSVQQPRASVTLEVRDAVEEPCPLVARRHEIVIRPQPGSLSVSEKILIDNPTSKCYVGRPAHDGAEPVTLELSIPPDFEQTTFQREFFGRRFSLVDGKLVTSLPWQPGARELEFTYVLRNDRKHLVWERPMDLPSSQVVVSVQSDEPDAVFCSLGSTPVRREGEVLYESDGTTLPPGHVIRVELGHLPATFITYGRWLTPLVLLTLIGGAAVVNARRRRRAG